MWCLVDCNNFFVSCERALDPTLATVPVVVLSNGDGCVVARSNESKAMGVKMGMPFFKMKELPNASLIVAKSGRMRHYRMISNGIMNLIKEEIGTILQYSIDETFFQIPGRPEQIEEFCLNLVKKIWNECKIPVSIGIAASKTLAKIASKQAKLAPELCGVCSLLLPEEKEYALRHTKVSDVWGVGRRTQPKLITNGYATAYELAAASPSFIETVYGSGLRNTVKELNGEDVIILPSHSIQKSISLSRTFPKMITSYDELAEQVASFAEGCAEKLRAQNTVCGEIGVYIVSNRFRTDLEQYENIRTRRFDVSCSNSIEILNSAMDLLALIFKPGVSYKKAGVVLNDISPNYAVQQCIFDDKQDLRLKYNKLTSAIDSINSSLGKSAINFALVTEEYSDGDAPAFSIMRQNEKR